MKALFFAGLLFVAACANTSTAVLSACDTYAATLTTLASYRAAGRLSQAQIERVDAVRAIANPICQSPAPPEGAEVISALEAAILQLAFVQGDAE